MKPPKPGHHRKIIHITVPDFFAAVEIRDAPHLAGCPFVVGEPPDKNGIVQAATPAARALGIQTGMALKTALRLCPDLEHLPPDVPKYRRTGQQLLAIFAEYTDLAEPVDLAETYLDVTYNTWDIPFGHRVAKLIQADVRRHLSLGATAGVAPNKFLAKLANNLAEDGLLAVLPDQVADFLSPLGIERLPGVGRVIQNRLRDLGLTTIGQLARYPEEDLSQHFGWRAAHLRRHAQGLDPTPVGPQQGLSSLSAETAFSAPIYERVEMGHALKNMVDEISSRLRRNGLMGRTLTLETRYGDLQSETHTSPLISPLAAKATILDLAQSLLQASQAAELGVRLLRLSVSGFAGEETDQLDLFQ